MFTDICFYNLSLNQNSPEVTIFQKTNFDNRKEIVAWKVIEKCNYQWTHPFRINWEYAYQLFDAHGNYSPVLFLNHTNISAYDIDVDFKQNEYSWVHFTKTTQNKIIGVNLLKNHRIIAKQLFNHIGGGVAFILSDEFYFCADLRVKPGGIIHPGNLNITETKFSLNQQKKIELVMKGGQPGPRSIPITFIWG